MRAACRRFSTAARLSGVGRSNATNRPRPRTLSMPGIARRSSSKPPMGLIYPYRMELSRSDTPAGSSLKISPKMAVVKLAALTNGRDITNRTPDESFT